MKLSSFQGETLGLIWMNQLNGRCFNVKKGDSWVTCRGNSGDAAEELKAMGLVRKNSDDGYVLTSDGKAIVPSLFMSKIDLKIKALEKERNHPNTCSHRRQQIILEIDALRRQKS